MARLIAALLTGLVAVQGCTETFRTESSVCRLACGHAIGAILWARTRGMDTWALRTSCPGVEISLILMSAYV